MKIQKGIPAPVPGKGRPAKYPTAGMEVGDSILVGSVNEASAVMQAARRRGWKFTRRKVAPGQYRIWRIA